uniref:Uncharacterized protein n=1 Tax=viral metagenome TaxID=1070528 RepID=A0A6C0HEL5_9ZZZZ
MSNILNQIDREIQAILKANDKQASEIKDILNIDVKVINKKLEEVNKRSIVMDKPYTSDMTPEQYNKQRVDTMLELLKNPDNVKDMQQITDELNKMDLVNVENKRATLCPQIKNFKNSRVNEVIAVYQTVIDTYGDMINSIYSTLLTQFDKLAQKCETETEYNNLKKLFFSAQKVLITKQQLNDMCQPLVSQAVDAKVCPTCPTCPTCKTCPVCKKSWFGLYKCSDVTEGFYGGNGLYSDNNMLMYIILLVVIFYLMKK